MSDVKEMLGTILDKYNRTQDHCAYLDEVEELEAIVRDALRAMVPIVVDKCGVVMGEPEAWRAMGTQAQQGLMADCLAEYDRQQKERGEG